MNSLHLILTITGSDRPACHALCLSAPVLNVCETEGEERKRGLCLIMFSVHCSQSELFIPRWSRSGELNSMFVKLMQKLPVDYYLSCILWPLRPVAKCSP